MDLLKKRVKSVNNSISSGGAFDPNCNPISSGEKAKEIQEMSEEIEFYKEMIASLQYKLTHDG